MDWKLIAQAQGLNLPAAEMDAVTGPLTTLEQTFRPLTGALTPDMEPDTALQLGGDEA